MRINDLTKDSVTYFDELKAGDVFKDDSGDVFIKTPEISDETYNTYNAIRLEDGLPCIFSDEDYVTEVKATLTIENLE